MQKFRKKPVVIEAWQWDGSDMWEWPDWMREYEMDHAVIEFTPDETRLMIPTLEGQHLANKGDWIIKGIKGELYPCKPDIFAATYEQA